MEQISRYEGVKGITSCFGTMEQVRATGRTLNTLNLNFNEHKRDNSKITSHFSKNIYCDSSLESSG